MIFSTGRKVRGLTFSAGAHDLENLVRAHRLVGRHAAELQPISWRHEWPKATLAQARRYAHRVLKWALQAPSPATAVVHVECRLRTVPGDHHTIAYLQNENWPGTLGLPSGGTPESPREIGVRLLELLGFHHLAVAYPSLDAQSMQGMEIRSDADQASLKFLGVSSGHPSGIMVTPFRRERAVSLFHRLLRDQVERVSRATLEVGGDPHAARQAHRERLIPFRGAAFTAEVRDPTAALVRRVDALSDWIDVSWTVTRWPTAAIRWFDVRLSGPGEGGYSLEVSSKDFRQVEKVKLLAKQWRVELEHAGEW